MRISPRWMILLDERILEFLDEEGPHSPSKIAEDDRILYGSQHIGNRCRKLAKYGLVRNVGNGVYNITDVGRRYPAGDLVFTDSELEDDSEKEATAD